MFALKLDALIMQLHGFTFGASARDPTAVRREFHRVHVRYVTAIFFDALIVFRVPQPADWIGEREECA